MPQMAGGEKISRKTEVLFGEAPMELPRELLQETEPSPSHWHGLTSDKGCAGTHHPYFSNFDQGRPSRDEYGPSGVCQRCKDYDAAYRLVRQTRHLPACENRLLSFRHNPNRSDPTISLLDAA